MSGTITNLFVSMRGAAFDMDQETLQSIITEIFSEFGEVKKVSIIMDRETNQPRGFGFVEMDSDGAQKAIEGLDGMNTEEGIELSVNIAKPKEDRPNRFGGNRSGGGRGGFDRNRSGGGSRRYDN